MINTVAILTMLVTAAAPAEASTTDWPSVIVAIFTVVLAAVAIAQVVVYSLQWRAMRDQVANMEAALKVARESSDAAKESADAAKSSVDHMRLEQRAWLGFVEPTIGPFLAGEPMAAMFTVRNTGLTPGTVIRQNSGVILRPAGDTDFEADVHDIISQAEQAIREHIAPPDFKLFITAASTFPFSQSTIEEIGSGTRTLFLFSYIRYLDISNQSHVSQGCYRYDPRDQRLFGHEKHNRMT